ncbi:MAG: transglutaminase-like domain-containing protein [Bacteroidota bacterium]|nr:transglutaminase-like domain-containing protein [Bacteroidota bacterium]
MSTPEHKDKELEALISMLDEPDSEMFGQIRGKIFSYGPDAIPTLEDAWENAFDDLIQQRIENIIHHIQLDDLYSELHNWSRFGYADLLRGYMLLTRFQYPDLDEDKIIQKIGRISQDVWLELNQNLTALEKVKVINHILFDIHKFKGNKANIQSPDNYYLNNILDTKKGNPVSLGLIFIIIAQSLKIPVYGVDLPRHFILSYAGTYAEGTETVVEKDKVLFYINPFNKGALFTKNEIELFIKQMGLEPNDSFYQPCNNVDIIKRVGRELILAYEKAGNKEKMEELKVLLEAMDTEEA